MDSILHLWEENLDDNDDNADDIVILSIAMHFLYFKSCSFLFSSGKEKKKTIWKKIATKSCFVKSHDIKRFQSRFNYLCITFNVIEGWMRLEYID